MLLAYVFWHQGAGGAEDYERRLAAFHDELPVPSGAFRLDRLPFEDGEPGYEDWYLVEDWTALGALPDLAMATAAHDPVAHVSRTGWGGVWRLSSGAAEVPEGGITWLDKPAGTTYAAWLAEVGGSGAWLRQMVLGPAPELAVVTGEASPGRVRVA